MKLDPKEDAFWDFSWPDMGQNDLPSMIEYVLNYSSQKALIYIGHSQGTLIAFSQLGTNAKLASQIKLFVALGPVATVGHIKSPIKLFADVGIQSTQLIWYKILGKRAFLPSTEIVEWLANYACNDPKLEKIVCDNVLFLFCGPSKYMNESRVAVYTTHTPAGTSVKNLIHFSQLVISNKFEMYDFGSAQENAAHYNQTQPPVYDLTRIKTPVALYSAQNDWLADPTDVEFLRKNLANIVDDYSLGDWDHLDFVWGTNTKPYLYDRMVQLMKKY